MKTIAVMVGNNQSEYINALLKDMDRISKERGIRILFFTGSRLPVECDDVGEGRDVSLREHQFSSIFDYIAYGGCDACIICYGSMSGIPGVMPLDDILDKCSSIPVMTFEVKSNRDDVPYLIADNYKSMSSVVRHLAIEHGYKNVAYLSGPRDNYSAMMRLKAYMDVMEEAGNKKSMNNIYYGDYTTRVKRIIGRILDENPDIEAICCANDNMARACYSVCENRNLVVGKDIAITGFDDIEISSKLNPGLTTVKHDSNLFANLALDMAIAMSEGKAVESIEYPVNIITRSSCGCDIVDSVEEKPITNYSSVINDEYINNLNISHDELKGIAGSLAKENDKIKSYAWEVSFFVREIIDSNIPSDRHYEELFKRLKEIGLTNAYLFVHRTPLKYEVDEFVTEDRHMYFAGGFDEKGKVIVPHDDWKHHLLSSHKGFNQFLPEGDGNYHTYVLFSGEEQYGVVLCKAPMEENEYLLYISLQISNLLHFFKIKRQEEKARAEMEISIERVKESNQILSFISRYDELTKILNRRGFMEQALATIHRRDGKEAVIMFADLDHLKEVNDCFGHGDGDFAIISAAKLLSGLMPRDGFCARIGGDEFVAFIPVPNDMTAKEQIDILKNKLKEAMFLFNLTCEKPYFIELSAGFHSFVCEEGMDLAEIIASSDEVLYEDKQKRRASIKKG